MKDLFTKLSMKIGNSQTLNNELVTEAVNKKQRIKEIEERIAQLEAELAKLKPPKKTRSRSSSSSSSSSSYGCGSSSSRSYGC